MLVVGWSPFPFLLSILIFATLIRNGFVEYKRLDWVNEDEIIFLCHKQKHHTICVY